MAQSCFGIFLHNGATPALNYLKAQEVLMNGLNMASDVTWPSKSCQSTRIILLKTLRGSCRSLI